jgi:hypothetical protein
VDRDAEGPDTRNVALDHLRVDPLAGDDPDHAAQRLPGLEDFRSEASERQAGSPLTGDQARPLADDLRRLPRLWLAFAIWLPATALRAWRRRGSR